jgi:hypothetical protein
VAVASQIVKYRVDDFVTTAVTEGSYEITLT